MLESKPKPESILRQMLAIIGPIRQRPTTTSAGDFALGILTGLADRIQRLVPVHMLEHAAQLESFNGVLLYVEAVGREWGGLEEGWL